MQKVTAHTVSEFLKDLSEQLIKEDKIKEITDSLVKHEHIMPVFGVEIEFYLTQNISFLDFEKELKAQGINYLEFSKEKGNNQFEISLHPTTDGSKLSQDIVNVRNKISLIASKLSGRAIFDSKPFNGDYGNAMHFHIGFVNTQEYLELSKVRDKDYINKVNLDVMARRLCHFIPDTFLIFAPKEEDYKRFVPNFLAPISVAFGGNNRTLPIRVPDTVPLRLEHRVACASADPYLVLVGLLQSISIGKITKDKIYDIPMINGSAYKKRYNLIPFPVSLDEACEKFDSMLFKM